MRLVVPPPENGATEKAVATQRRALDSLPAPGTDASADTVRLEMKMRLRSFEEALRGDGED